MSISLFASSLLFGFSFLLFNYLNLGFLNSFGYSFIVGSVPMIILFITGSFGGYFAEDISLFSLITNRIKAFFIALAMLLISYTIIHST